ncbi:MAG: hypothetical protein WKF30_17525 [Pyrinomonadaceae bacterium]
MRDQFLRLALARARKSPGALAQQKAAPSEQQAAPSVERLRAHVNYLSSTQLEGRRTGTAGADAAAEYIASEFMRYGRSRPPRKFLKALGRPTQRPQLICSRFPLSLKSSSEKTMP